MSYSITTTPATGSPATTDLVPASYAKHPAISSIEVGAYIDALEAKALAARNAGNQAAVEELLTYLQKVADIAARIHL